MFTYRTNNKAINNHKNTINITIPLMVNRILLINHILITTNIKTLLIINKNNNLKITINKILTKFSIHQLIKMNLYKNNFKTHI